MLHLQPRVHFHEVHGVRLQVEDELDGAGADVTDFVRDRRGVLQHRLAQILRQHRRIGLFEDLLLVALHAAVAQPQHPAVAVHVAQQLRFDVAQRRNVLFEVNVAVAECGARFHRDAMERLVEVVGRIDHLNAFAAAAVHRLDQHRVTDLIGDFGGAFDVRQNAVASRYHRNFEPQRRVDRVRLVAHRFHAGDRRADEIDAVAAAQLGEARILRQKADARVQRIDAVRARRRATRSSRSDSSRPACCRRCRPRDRPVVSMSTDGRIHVRVGLHEHHFDAVALSDADQFHRGTSARVDQHALDRPHQIAVAELRPSSAELRPLHRQRAEHHPVHDLHYGFGRQRNLRIDLAQPVVEIVEERMPYQALHRARHHRQVVRQRRRRRQVRRHHDLAGERHVGAAEVIRLRERMRDEARLRTAGAIAEAEHDHRQFGVAHESRDAIVDGRHREQCAGAFLRLHAARRDETDHRQLPFRAVDEQLAEFLGARHVERAGLEIDVRNDRADADAAGAVVERADPGNDAARGNLGLERAFDGDSKAGEFAGVGTEQVAVEFFEVGEERVDQGAVSGGFAPFVLVDHFLDAQIAIRDRQTIPEVLAATDRARRDAAVVAAAVLLRLQMHAEQPLEQERDDDEQRIRQVRKAGLLPFFHRAEEVGAARRIGHAQEPAEKLRRAVARPPLRRDAVPALPLTAIARRLRERRVQQLRDGAFRQRARRLRLFGDGVEMLDDLVVHRIEQQQVFALGDEVVAQCVVDQHVEHRHVARLRGGCRHFLAAEVRRIAVVEDLPVHRHVGAPLGEHRLDARRQQRIVDQIRQAFVGERKIDLGGELVAQIAIGFVTQAANVQQFFAFVAEAFPKQWPEHPVGRQCSAKARGSLISLMRNSCSRIRMIAQKPHQRFQIALRLALPAVVQVHADAGQQIRAGIFVVLARFAEQQLRDTAALVVHRLFLFVVAAPGLRQRIVVDDLFRDPAAISGTSVGARDRRARTARPSAVPAQTSGRTVWSWSP